MLHDDTRAMIREYLASTENPMQSTPKIVKRCTGSWLGSGDREYVHVYLMLEDMLKRGELFAASVTNGGNVYMLKSRAVPPVRNASGDNSTKASDLDKLPF